MNEAVSSSVGEWMDGASLEPVVGSSGVGKTNCWG